MEANQDPTGQIKRAVSTRGQFWVKPGQGRLALAALTHVTWRGQGPSLDNTGLGCLQRASVYVMLC